MARKTPYDPIVDKSLAPHFFIVSGILFLTAVLIVIDDMYWRRPWKSYQGNFATYAGPLYEEQLAEVEDEIDRWSGEGGLDVYQEAAAASEAAAEATEANREAIREANAEIDRINELLEGVRGDIQDLRGLANWATYQLETTGDPVYRRMLADRVIVSSIVESESERLGPDRLREELEEALGPDFEPETIDDENRVRLEHAVIALNGVMSDFQSAKDELAFRIRELQSTAPEARAVLERLTRKRDILRGLRGALAEMEVDIRQKFRHEPEFIDRCMSCHVAIDEDPAILGEDEWRSFFASSAGQRLVDEQDLSDEEVENVIGVYHAHPGKHLDRHPVAEFGCTLCHHGQGYATTNAWEAHTYHEDEADPDRQPENGYAWSDRYNHPMDHWTQPMYPGEAREAGCVKCHIQTRHVELPEGERVSQGRQLMEDLGCYGCHTIRSFNTEFADLQDAREGDRESRDLVEAYEGTADRPGLTDILSAESIEETAMETGQPQKAALVEELEARGHVETLSRAMPDLERRLAALPDGWDLLDGAADLDRELGNLVHDVRDAAERNLDEAEAEYQPPAPELLRIREKVQPEWLAVWLAGPRDFRPSTWMPDPMLRRVTDPTTNQPLGHPDAAQIGPIMSYLWLQAETPRDLPDHDLGDPARGEALFREKGCIGCHMAEPVPADEISPRVRAGRRFGPNLARVGEKVRPEWLVEWLVAPQDYAPHSRMPDPRVTEREASDIAAWLMTLRDEDAEDPTFAGDATTAEELAEPLDRYEVELPEEVRARIDEIETPLERGRALYEARLQALRDRNPGVGDELAERVEQGRVLVERYGCYNCHTVNGLDPSQRIGTELSQHGSKELEMLDFGLIEEATVEVRPADQGPEAGVRFPTPPTGERGRTFWPASAGEGPWAHGDEDGEDHGEDHGGNGDEAHGPVARESEGDEELPMTMEEGGYVSLPNNSVSPERTRWVLAHSRFAHFYTKIRWPRIFDLGRHRPGLFVQEGEVPRFGNSLRMPNFGLSNEEALAIVTYLLGLTEEEMPASHVYSPDEETEQVLAGEQLMRKFNCRGCHQLSYPTGQEMEAWDDVIDRHLEEPLVEHLADAGQTAQSPRGEVDEPVNVSGEAAARNYLPPLLDGEGRRVRPDWLYRFLRNPAIAGWPDSPTEGLIRPNLLIRMPNFRMSREEADALVAYFASRDEAEYPYEVPDRPAAIGSPPRPLTDEEVESRHGGLGVVIGRDPGTPPGQSGGSQCLNCHYLFGDPPVGMTAEQVPGPDLAIVRDRLRYDWTIRWLTSPPRLVPGSAMPENWPMDRQLGARQPYDGILSDVPEEERAAAQVRAVAEFLYRLGEEGPSLAAPGN